MSGRSVNLTTLFLGRLRPPKRLTSTSRTYFRQLLTTVPLESAEGETKVRGGYEMKCITRVSSNLLVHHLIVGKYGTSSICSPRMICEILPCFYHLFGEKSMSNLQLLNFILLTI